MKYSAVFLLLCICSIGPVCASLNCLGTCTIPSSAIQNCIPLDSSLASQMSTNDLVIRAEGGNQMYVDIDGRSGVMTPYIANYVPVGGYGWHNFIMRDAMMNRLAGKFNICPNTVTIITVDTNLDHYNYSTGNYITPTVAVSGMKFSTVTTSAITTVKPGTGIAGLAAITTVVPVKTTVPVPVITTPGAGQATTQVSAGSPNPSSGDQAAAASTPAADNGIAGTSPGSGTPETGSPLSGSPASGSLTTGSPDTVGQLPAGTGSLSITTTPAGAMVFIDGTQVGLSPTTVPGLAAGPHTILMELDGYSNLTATVTITAGQTQSYTTGLSRTGKSPGFEFIAALMATGAVIGLKKRS